MIRPGSHSPSSLLPAIDRAFALATPKLLRLHQRWNPSDGTPVFTINGIYSSRGWTEWTQGFLFGAPLLVFEATGDERLLDLGRTGTFRHMASHLTHTGVHDHGFNNVSTYGNLLRLAAQNKYEASAGETEACRIALKVSGAVQAARWTPTHDGGGFIFSFNGPHSLFADTVRSLRSLALAHQFGHILMGEHDEKINLLGRLLQHAEATARYNVYFGNGRDHYDIRGRVVHESVFNTRDGRYRCPSSQQGYSPFTTWTRGLAWVLLGFAEQLEWLETLDAAQFAAVGADKPDVLARFLETARATADFHLQYTPADGIPYWDTGAPGLDKLGNYLDRPADPFNDHEPVDSSAAAIAAQGLLRLGRYCSQHGDASGGEACTRAALTTAATLLGDPYLSTSDNHEGLLLHTVYHRPNGWDHIPEGRRIPCGESCLWGDYHLLELAICLWRLAHNLPPHSFFQGIT